MDKNKHLVSVYGTLRNGFGNHRLLASSKLVVNGRTAELMEMRASGIPYVTKKNQTSRIIVEVYEVDDNTLRQLDSLEGHPRFYERQLTTIEGNDGSTHEAWMYYCDGGGTLVESGDYSDYRKRL